MNANTIKPERSGFIWLHRILDTVLPTIALFAIVIWYGFRWDYTWFYLGLLGGLAFTFFAQMIGIYQQRRGRHMFASALLVIRASVLTWFGLLAVLFLSKESANFSRVTLVVWGVTMPAIAIGYRVIIKILLQVVRGRGYGTTKVVVVGMGGLGKRIASIMQNNIWMGYEVVGFYDDDTSINKYKNLRKLGATSDLASSEHQNRFDEVYIALPLRSDKKIKELLNDLSNSHATVKLVPDILSFDLMYAEWLDMHGIPIVSVYSSPLNNSLSRFIKRTEDLVFSTIILLLASPIMLFILIGVKISSPGPIFYKQTRVSWNGKKFRIIKFRSMPHNLEDNGVKWGGSKEKVSFRFGSFVRRTSLDELPQFINVLKGEMSIVGPRPERDVFVKKFREEIPRYMQKHMVKAGITGLAQINGCRGDTSLKKRLEFDLHYIKTWSVWLDIKIIVLTILDVLSSKSGP